MVNFVPWFEFTFSSPRKQMSLEEEKQFLKQIQVANTIIYAVCAAFEIGNYICTGNELGSGAFSQVTLIRFTIPISRFIEDITKQQNNPLQSKSSITVLSTLPKQ